MLTLYLFRQEASARKLGIRMLAIHSDSKKAATQGGRNLWKEARDLLWDFIAVTPKELQSPDFAQFIKLPQVASQISIFAIDEAHMILTWGKDSQTAFDAINQLSTRCELDSDPRWFGLQCQPPCEHLRVKNRFKQSSDFNQASFMMRGSHAIVLMSSTESYLFRKGWKGKILPTLAGSSLQQPEVAPI